MKTREYYEGLNYPIVVNTFVNEEVEVYTAEILELPGLKVYGDTYEEVIEEINDAKSAWFEVNLELDRPIPEPEKEIEVSGRVTLRMSKSLHAALKTKAIKEGVNLNPLINEMIIKGMNNDFSEKVFNSLMEIKNENNILKDQNNELIRKVNLLEHSRKELNYTHREDDSTWKKEKTHFNLKGLILGD